MKKFLALTMSVVTAMSAGGCARSAQKPSEPTEDYGTLSICDTYAWLGNYNSIEYAPTSDPAYPPTEIALCFSKPEKSEALTYSYDKTLISIDDKANTVRALKEGVAQVTATSKHFNTTFTVTCETVNKDTADKGYSLTQHQNGDPKGWDGRVRGFENDWKQNGHNGLTTVFIGDSFFDASAFWQSFYTDYAGKDALCWGIGSTTTCSWETIIEKLLKKTAPKNIVMHCGTNDVFDLRRSVGDITSSLERIFSLMHYYMPSTTFYWFNITTRFPCDIEKEGFSEEVNRRFAAWATGRKWIKVIDTRSKLGVDKIKQDGIHPNDLGYAVFRQELDKSGIKMYNAN